MKRFILFLLAIISFVSIGLSDTLTVAYQPSPPFIIEGEEGNPEGINIWMWERIHQDLDISFQYKKLPLEKILSGLESGEVDVSINPLTVTSQRNEIMDFSQPFYVSNSTVLINESSTLQKAWSFIGSFFNLNFWKAVFALFVVIFIFGFLVWVFERKRNTEEFQPGMKGVWSGIWWSAVTMTTVGYGDKSPQTTGGKVIGLIWMFAAIIIISGFTAGIASSLTVNQLSWNQTSIMDFKETEIGTVQKSATSQWLDKKFFKEVKTYKSVIEGVEALKSNEVKAFLYDEPQLAYSLQEDDRYKELEILPIQYNLQYYSLGFSESLPDSLQENISQKVIELKESRDWEIILSEYGLQIM